MELLDLSELFSAVFFILGYVWLLLKQDLKILEAQILLALFTAGLLLLAPRMVFLALNAAFADLILVILLFIIGLLLAFIANARGEYFVGRKPARR